MRVAALYLVAAAFVIATSTPGPHPWVNGGAFAISADPKGGVEEIELASNLSDRGLDRPGMRLGAFDSDLGTTISINAAVFDVDTVKDHPAAKRHAELTSMLAVMTPPIRRSGEIRAEMDGARAMVDQRQKVFDSLASELDVLREELSQMDRRETATEIASRIDATQSKADSVRGDLVNALMGLTAAQSELKNALRYEDLESELVALEEMMMSVRSNADNRKSEVASSETRARFDSNFDWLAGDR